MHNWTDNEESRFSEIGVIMRSKTYTGRQKYERDRKKRIRESQ